MFLSALVYEARRGQLRTDFALICNPPPPPFSPLCLPPPLKVMFLSALVYEARRGQLKTDFAAARYGFLYAAFKHDVRPPWDYSSATRDA